MKTKKKIAKKKAAKKKSIQRKDVGQKEKVIIKKDRVVIEPMEVNHEQKKNE